VIARAVAVWLAILALASANGAARAAWLIPRYGEEPGRAISTLVLSLVTFPSPSSAGAATVGFEFLAGHYLFGTPWHVLLADYDVTRGRIWVVVLVLVGVMPLVAARTRRVVA
jgi:hypothetical protein